MATKEKTTAGRIKYTLRPRTFHGGLVAADTIRPIMIGRTEDSDILTISHSHLRKHCMLVGISGTGKTELQKQILWQIACDGYGIMAVDFLDAMTPANLSFFAAQHLKLTLQGRTHDSMFNRIQRRFHKEALDRFVYVDVGDKDIRGTRVNPLEMVGDGRTPNEIGSSVAEVIAGTTSNKNQTSNLDEMRRLQSVLVNVLTLLSAAGGTIIEVPQVLLLTENQINDFFTAVDNRARRLGLEVELDTAREYIQKFFYGRLSERQRVERFESTFNLLGGILQDPRTKRLLSSPKSNFYFHDAIRKGQVVLLRCPEGLGRKTQGNIASLFIDMLCQAAKNRPKSEKEIYPFHLMIDEFHLCLNRNYPTHLATTRNHNLRWILAHQTLSQLSSNGGDMELYEGIVQNCSTRIYMRMGEEDASKVSSSVFYSDGKKLKHEYKEFSNSISKSIGRSTSNSISKTISQSLAHAETVSFTTTEGQTLSFGQSNGVSVAEVQSLGLSFAESKGWSRVKSQSHGVTVSCTNSETIVEGSGQASGTSQNQSNSSTEGSGESYGYGEGTGEGMFVSFPGQHDLNGLSSAMTSSNSNNTHKSWNESHSHNRSKSESIGSAISNVISKTRSLSKGSSHGEAQTQSSSFSKGENQSETRSVSRSLAKSLANMYSFSESIGKSINQGLSKGYGRTKTEARSFGQSQSESESFTESTGTTEANRKAFYSVSEQQVIDGYKLSLLEPRGAYVVVKGKSIEVQKIRTLDNPQHFETRWGSTCFVDDLLKRTRLPNAEPVKGTVIDRMREELLMYGDEKEGK